MKKKYLLVIIICALSTWFWIIVEKSLLIGIICLSLSLLVLEYLLQRKTSYIKKIMILSLFLVISIYLIINFFDRGLFKNTETESALIMRRQNYFAQEFGKLYRNRFGIYYSNNFRPFAYKYLGNIANALDLETYFSSDSINGQKARLSIIFLPFMLLGIYYSLKIFDRWMYILIVVVLMLSGFVNTQNNMGPIMFFPLISSFTVFGITKLFLKKI